MVLTEIHPDAVVAELRDRCRSLERELRENPDDERVWFWRTQLRVNTFLLRRQTAAVEFEQDQTPGDEPDPETGPAGSPDTRSWPEPAATDLAFRAAARSLFTRILAHFPSIGEHVRREALLAADREARQNARNRTIWRGISALITCVTLALTLGLMFWGLTAFWAIAAAIVGGVPQTNIITPKQLAALTAIVILNCVIAAMIFGMTIAVTKSLRRARD